MQSPGFESAFDEKEVILETGGTSLQDSPHGFAYAGLRIDECPSKLKVNTKNSIYDHPCGWGEKKLLFRYKVSTKLLSFVIDYETSDKREFTHRVAYQMGYAHVPERVKLPGWGKTGCG